MHPRIRTKSELPELVIEPFCLSPHRSFMVEIDCTVYHLLVKNNKGREWGGGGLLTFFPRKGEGAYWEGGLIYRLLALILEIEKGA